MRRQTRFIFRAILILVWLVLLFQTARFVPLTHATPTSPAVVTPSPTPPPTLAQEISSTENAIFGPILALLNFAAALFITALVVILVRRIWQLSRVSNLVGVAFKNATGDDSLDKVLPGLNQLTREILARGLEEMRQRIRSRPAAPYQSDQFPTYNLSKFPVPQEATDDRLTTLLTSLKDVATGPVQTAVQLLNLVVTPRGTTITATLQKQDDPSPAVGVSLQVADLQGKQDPVLLTICEAPVHPAAQQNAAETASEGRWLALVKPAARWLAILIARRSLEAIQQDASYRARLSNFIGAFHQASAQTFSTFPFFYTMAISDFRKAISLDPSWFQLYENLADTYVMMVQGLMQQKQASEEAKTRKVASLWDELLDGENAVKVPVEFSWRNTQYRLPGAWDRFSIGLVGSIPPWRTDGDQENEGNQTVLHPWQPTDQDRKNLYEALIHYDKAQELLQGEVQGTSMDGEEKQRAQRWIRLGICTAQLLIGEQALAHDAIQGIIDIQQGRGTSSEKDAYILYNMACWYAIADRQQVLLDASVVNTDDDIQKDMNIQDPGQIAKSVARCYLTCSLARDQNLWDWSAYDPSLFSVFNRGERDKLTRALTAQLYKRHITVPPGDLSALPHADFVTAVKEVLQEVGWLEQAS